MAFVWIAIAIWFVVGFAVAVLIGKAIQSGDTTGSSARRP